MKEPIRQEIRPGEQSEKTESCPENLWNEIEKEKKKSETELAAMQRFEKKFQITQEIKGCPITESR